MTLGNFDGLILYKRVTIPKGRQTRQVLVRSIETAKETVRNLNFDPQGRLDPASLEATQQLLTFQLDVALTLQVLTTVSVVGAGIGIGVTLGNALITTSFGFAI